MPPHPLRRSTRVSWRVRVRLSGIDRSGVFDDDCETLVVNLHGCALQSPRALRCGTPIQLEVADRILKGRVVDAVPLAEDQTRWMLGIALEQVGNHWGIQYPPEDWGSAPPPLNQQAVASDRTPRSLEVPLPGDGVVNAASEDNLGVARPPVERCAPAEPAGGNEIRPLPPPPRAPAPPPPPRPIQPAIVVSEVGPPAPAADAVPQEVRAQLRQLQQAQAKQEAMLLQERAERQAARSAAEQAIADQLERVRQAKEYVESLVCSFPSILEAQAQEQAQAMLRRLQPQASRAELEKLVRDGQKAAEAALEQRIAGLADGLRRHLEQTIEDRRQTSEAAHAAAAQQLQELEERANHVTALVDVELQKHAEEIVAEAVADIRQQLPQLPPQPQPGQVEFAQELQGLVRQAQEAAAALRQTLKAVQQEHRMNEAATARLHHRSEAVQSWLAQETEKFQQTVHEAFLDAGGEIRGRIAQAVETATEPVEARSQDLQQQMAALAQQQIEEVHRQVELACRRMESCSAESQAEIAAALQARVAEALGRFTQDAQRLAQSSIERWQLAITQTLSAIPKLLADNLTTPR